MLNFIWSTPLRKFITSATVFFAFISGAGAAYKTMIENEPLWPAQRWFAREVAKAAVAQLQPTVNYFAKSAVERDLSDAKTKKLGAELLLTDETNPKRKEIIQNTVEELDTKIKGLEKLKSDLNAPPGSGAATK